MKKCRVNCFSKSKREKVCVAVMIAWLISQALIVEAQDGSAGINTANTAVRGYFDTGINLMYAIGAVVGLIGAIRVYQKWSHGDHDTSKVAASWFGSCIFLVIVATVLKSFFGVA